MRKIDALILREIVGPWAFGAGLFTSLLFAGGGLLNKITSFIVGGASFDLVARLIGLALPAIFVKTFSMAMLLAGLLGFGRLSSDSEIIALKAGGASLPRILRPIFLASLVVAGITFFFNDRVVPYAERTALNIMLDLGNKGRIGGKADARALMQRDKHGDEKMVAVLGARQVDLATGIMRNVEVTIFDAQERARAVLVAPQVTFNPPDDWRVGGPARIVPLDADVNPREVVHLVGGAWPAGVPKPKSSLDDLFSKGDYDAYTLSELSAKIVRLKSAGEMEPKAIRDFEYGYFNKFSVALAALVFGPLGSALGIQNRRTGSASGFALAVGIIFGYIALANFMNVWAQGGVLPPWAASFAPLCIGAVACGVIIYRRNA